MAAKVHSPTIDPIQMSSTHFFLQEKLQPDSNVVFVPQHLQHIDKWSIVSSEYYLPLAHQERHYPSGNLLVRFQQHCFLCAAPTPCNIVIGITVGTSYGRNLAF